MAAIPNKNFNAFYHLTTLPVFGQAQTQLNFAMSANRYAMRAKDSGAGYVYWTSMRSALEVPAVTSPALIGSIVVGSVEVVSIERVS